MPAPTTGVKSTLSADGPASPEMLLCDVVVREEAQQVSSFQAEIGDDIGGLVSWITEAGGSNSYFLLISCFPSDRLFIRVLVKNKVTSLKENCIEAVGPHMRRRQESEIRKLELPTVLIDKLVEYKMKDEQYYHENATEDIEMTTSQ